MTKDTTYTWVTAPMYVCCSPEMGHVVVWCTEYVCRLTSSYRHTAAHTAIGVCVCALHAWGKNVCIPICISLTVYLSLPQGAGDNRAEWGQIRTGVLWSGTAHLVMPAWEDSCGSLVLQPLILHLVRGEKKGSEESFSSPTPESIIVRRPKQSNYELHTHWSWAALHSSVGEAGGKDLFVSFKSVHFISLRPLALLLSLWTPSPPEEGGVPQAGG